MTLSTALVGAVEAAMSAVGDLKDVASAYMINGDPVYDDTTGTYTTPTKSDSNIPVLLYEFEAEEILSNVSFQTDQKLLLESRLLRNVTTPEYFVIDDVRWDVISPMRVPGDSVRIFHVRNTGQAA